MLARRESTTNRVGLDGVMSTGTPIPVPDSVRVDQSHRPAVRWMTLNIWVSPHEE